MKKIFILFILFVATKTFAQTNGISYQAIILNPKGEQLPGVNNASSPVVNKDICMVFKFVDEFSNVEYQETVQIKTDGFGMVNLVIGKGTQTAGYAASFQSIVWSSSKKSLIVGINTNGNCATYTEISNQEFSYAPLAFSAINAENVTGVVAIENGGTNAVTVLGARTNLQLDNVDNTTDLNKPVSTATQTALNLKENTANKSTDILIDGNSDIKYPSVKSVKMYVDGKLLTSSDALDAEINRATIAENTIAANLVTETNNRTAANNTLTTSLATETAARTSADATLTSNLSDEVANRTAGDLLKEDVANKSTNVATDGTSDTKYPSVKSVKTYVDASATLSSTALANEISRATAAENTIAANLTTETAARTSADATLTTNLATEVTNRTAADLLKEDLANKSTNVATDGTSDTKYPSVKSVKTYVDASTASSSMALANEITRATTAENTIAANLTAETTARTSADATLTSNLSTEAANRTAADLLKEDLANKSTNVTTDGTSDTKYPSVKSVKTYVDAGTALSSTALTNEITRATTAENTVAANLTTETAARTSADATLTTNLATEVTNRTVADLLKEDVANKSTNVTTDGTSDTKYPSVKSVKIYVDASTASASTDLTNEVSRATAAENTIATNLTAETAARTSADATLTTNLSTEVTNRTAADLLKEDLANKSTNVTTDGTSDTKYPSVKSVKTYVDTNAASASTALANEVTRATAAENTIATNLTTETSARTSADATLQTNINVVQADVDANETAANTTLNLKAPLASPTFTGTVSGITKAMVGLGNVDNTTDLLKPVSTAIQTALDLKVDKVTGKGLSTEDYTSTEKTKLAAITGTNTGDQDISGIAANTSKIGDLTSLTTTAKSSLVAAVNEIEAGKAPLASPTFTGTVSGITKAMVGLGNVDNTSDVSKPVSTATQTALDLKVDKVTGERLINASEIAKLSNQSGTNTGDQDLSSYATNTALALKAPLASPTLTGIPVAPTATAGTNSTQIATTAFVTTAITGSFVDLTTNQTVAGTKTFSSDLTINSTKYGRGAGSDLNSRNIAIGNSSLSLNSTGSWNTAVGTYALQKNTGSSSNTAIGNEAISESAPGSNNTGVGSRALMYTSGAGNTSVGTNALINSAAGNNNTAIGLNAFSTNTTGSNNTAIGASTVVSSVGLTNATAIGYGATVANDNTIQLGNTSVTDVKTSGTLTAGTVTYPKTHGTSGQVLSTNGSGTLSWSTPSVATSANFVDLTTDQTIAGTKSFDSNLIVKGITVGASLGMMGIEPSNTLLGYNVTATNASESTVVGYKATANGSQSIALGSNASANQTQGISIGFHSAIGSGYGFAIGSYAQSNAMYSTALGAFATTGGNYAVALGYQANASAENSIAIGKDATVSTSNTIQLGNTSITSVKTSGAITANSYVKSGGTSSQYLMADGSVSTGPAAVREVTDEFTATVAQTSFTLTQTPSANSKVKMYVNGIRISNTAYSVVGTTFTYNPTNNGGYALSAGDRIQMDFYY